MEPLVAKELIKFDPEKRARVPLLRSDGLICEMVCYEPGQETEIHYHPFQDEVFYCLEGQGAILVGEQRIPVGPTSMVFVPAQTPHGVVACEGGRFVILFVKGPGTRRFNLPSNGATKR